MLCRRLVFPIIIVALIGSLLGASVPVATQRAHAAPQQEIFDITTEMVPNNWPMIPSGLSPGDSFRLMFVTLSTTDGTTNGIGRYNSFVIDEARKNPEIKNNMSALFKALVSVYQGLDARGNTRTRAEDPGANSPIYWVYGDKVADNYADFYDGSWDSRQARNVHGQRMTGAAYSIHTGSTAQGTVARGKGNPPGNYNWDLGLGSPPAWWAYGIRKSMRGQIGSDTWSTPGKEIHNKYYNSSDPGAFYGISPLLKIRSTTGPKPIITGPTATTRSPFDVTITFPDDYLVLGMAQSDIVVTGGTPSNFRHTSGAGSPSVGPSTAYTVTITPDYAPSIYEPTTVSVSMGAGAVTDSNEWASVASDTFTVKAAYLNRVATTIPFGENGVGTVPKSWALIPSASLKPGDSFRLMFVTSDTRDGQSSNIGDYNWFVAKAAARNDLLNNFSGRFRALASVYGTDAIDNTGTRGTGVPIFWLEGNQIANSYPDFYDGSWASKAGTDEQGNLMGYRTEIWVGTDYDGSRKGRGLGGLFTGRYDRLGVRVPFGNSVTSLDFKMHFYGLSPVLKIEEPGGL